MSVGCTAQPASESERLAQALLLFHQFGKSLMWIRSLASHLDSTRSMDLEDTAAKIRELTDEMGEATRRFLGPERGQARETLGAVIEHASRAIEQTGKHLRLEAAVPDHAASQLIDSRAGVVLTNLIENALLASDEGARVFLQADFGGDRVQIRIIDDGEGMDEATLQRCAERGFTTRRSDGGTGTGLFASKKLMGSMGGQLEIRSQLGTGTVATIRIPCTSDE